MENKSTALTVRIPSGTVILPDNAQWTNRFPIHSSTSDKTYIVAQHKSGRYWGCDCRGWKRHKKCHHLTEIGLPNYMRPYEVKLTSGGKK